MSSSAKKMFHKNKKGAQKNLKTYDYKKKKN